MAAVFFIFPRHSETLFELKNSDMLKNFLVFMLN